MPYSYTALQRYALHCPINHVICHAACAIQQHVMDASPSATMHHTMLALANYKLARVKAACTHHICEASAIEGLGRSARERLGPGRALAEGRRGAAAPGLSIDLGVLLDARVRAQPQVPVHAYDRAWIHPRMHTSKRSHTHAGLDCRYADIGHRHARTRASRHAIYSDMHAQPDR